MLRNLKKECFFRDHHILRKDVLLGVQTLLLTSVKSTLLWDLQCLMAVQGTLRKLLTYLYQIEQKRTQFKNFEYVVIPFFFSKSYKHYGVRLNNLLNRIGSLFLGFNNIKKIFSAKGLEFWILNFWLENEISRQYLFCTNFKFYY